jgi:hypothetical protein
MSPRLRVAVVLRASWVAVLCLVAMVLVLTTRLLSTNKVGLMVGVTTIFQIHTNPIHDAIAQIKVLNLLIDIQIHHHLGRCHQDQ